MKTQSTNYRGNAALDATLALETAAASALPLPAVVDQLADVQTQIPVLEAREKELKTVLIASGQKEVCGSTLRAVISTTKASVTVAWKAVAEALNPPQELIDANSTPKAPVTSVRLCGYN